MRKKILEKRLKRLEAKKAELKTRALASEDVNEVRTIQAQITDIDEDIADTKEELDAIAEEERQAAAQANETRGTQPPAGATLQNGSVLGAFSAGESGAQEHRDADPYASMEYRRAFMAYAQHGTAIPANLTQRDEGVAANTNTLGATIPTTILNEFINLVQKRYGNLYAKVRKLNVPGAVKIPISDLQASFKWITESTVSPRQDGGRISEFVEFSYNMAEIRVAQTLLSSIVTIDQFEREVVRVMLEAYMQAMDEGIVRGTGVGQMLGILNDPRVINTGNTISMTAAQMSDWTQWRKRLFAKMPLGYRYGEFIFPLATVDAYLETMADNNNNPIFRQASDLQVNDGDAINPNGRFFGRDISLVEPDILPDFDSAASGDVIGIYWQPNEYAINTQMAFGMRRYFDEERNEWVNKMLTIVDGKVLNPMGYWLITKA
ncbi:MAG: phage major capsid protein [Clostridia bacterium]|nr:phage major capsid protein [Clostridia bacterium]